MEILLLDDGIKGNFNQAYGIAQSFPDSNITVLKILFKGPSYILPGRKGVHPFSSKILAIICHLRIWGIGVKVLSLLTDTDISLLNNKPDIVISAGSVLAPINLIIAKNNPQTFSVNIMTPSFLPLKLFDSLIIPMHDYIRLRNRSYKNLIITLGAPNRITEKFLTEARDRLEKIISIPERYKRIGLIIGGDDQNYRISRNFLQNLLNALQKIGEDYVFLVTTSRRTNKTSVAFLKKYLPKNPAVKYYEFPGYSKSSQYPGILSLCDLLIVTEDSVNMISEAAATGKPLIILGVERNKSAKRLVFDITIEKFIEKGYAEYLSEAKLPLLSERVNLAVKRSFNRLSEAEECVLKILKRLNSKKSSS